MGEEKNLPDLTKPALPPTVATGHHGGSSGYLMNEFVTAILEDRKPLVDIVMALNMTVSRHRRASVGVEGRRTDEDSAVHLIARAPWPCLLREHPETGAAPPHA